MFAVIITIVVIVISFILQYCFSLLKILFKRPLPPKGAVEIDPIEHIYAHPDFTRQLKDPKTLDVTTVYDVLQRGLKLAANRPQFSFRSSSNEKFQSYTYKSVDTVREIDRASDFLDNRSRSSKRSAVELFKQAFSRPIRRLSASTVRHR